MGLTLVLAGNHRQFLGWVHNVYGRRGSSPGLPPPRYVSKPEDLWLIPVEDVDNLHQVGTYWENPLWGSEDYSTYMGLGVAEGKHWAMTPQDDWRKAENFRQPVTPEQMENARRRLLALERELTSD